MNLNPPSTWLRLRTACTTGLLPLLLLTLVSPAQAQFNYTTNNGTITITGYTGPDGAVVIPATINGLQVTSIGRFAFNGLNGVTSVTIPDGVINIGNGAFQLCTSLASVTIPNSVTGIGTAAFQFCTSLASVAIPNSVTGIGFLAFNSCSSLTNVTIPDSVTSIGDQAFASCSSLTSVTIPSSVTSIGIGPFRFCTSMSEITVDALNPAYASVDGVLFNKNQTFLIQCPGAKTGPYTIPTSVTSIRDYAFASCAELVIDTIPNSVSSIGFAAFTLCRHLTIDTIPDSVASIGGLAFYGCPSLTSITIPNSVTSIGEQVFAECTNLGAIMVEGLNPVYSSVDGVLFNKDQTVLIQYPAARAGSFAIPNSVTSIGNYAFAFCANLTSVTIPNSIRGIGDFGFYSCASLNSLTIPDGVTSIGIHSFRSCTSLTTLNIPSSVTNIGTSAFIVCTSLNAITVDPLNANFSSVDGVLFDKSQTALIQFPGGKSGSYTIPNSVTSVRGNSFFSCTNLTSVTIPASLTSLGSGFLYCSSLSAINVDALNPVFSSVDGVLLNKSQTLVMDFPDGRTGGYTIPNSVTNIGPRVFASCSNLTSVTIPNSVTSIGDSAFLYCTSLTGIYFQGNAPTASSGAFASADNATVYFLPGTTGWGTTFAGRPTVLWNPLINTADATFGVRTNRFGFNITGTSNLVLVVEASTNLVTPVWSPVGTNTLTGGSSYFSDPEWTNHPVRFYRLRSP